MDIWNIIQMAFGGGVVAGIVEVCAAIRHRKADKVKAEAEAAQASANAQVSDIEAQKAKIDLGEMFLGKAQEWFTQIEQIQKKGNEDNAANQEKMMQRLERIDERTENVELSLADVVKYLNGDYQQWLANHHKPTNRYGQN
jgi:gas vesicle protein